MASVTCRVEIYDESLRFRAGTIFRGFHDEFTTSIERRATVLAPVGRAFNDPYFAEARVNGMLRRSIRKLPTSGDSYHISGGVGAFVNYAAAVHEGSRERSIFARRAIAMRFWWRSALCFRDRVGHPAARPNRFLLNAAREVMAADPRVEH